MGNIDCCLPPQNIPNSKSSFPSERSHLYSSFTVSILNDQNPKLDKNNINLIKTGDETVDINSCDNNMWKSYFSDHEKNKNMNSKCKFCEAKKLNKCVHKDSFR